MAELLRLSHISEAYYGRRRRAVWGSGEGRVGAGDEGIMNALYHLFPGLYNTFMTCGASLPDAIAAAPRGGGVRRPFVQIYWRVQERRSGFYHRGDQEELEWRWRGKIKRRLEATCFWFSGGKKVRKVTCLSLRRGWDVSSSQILTVIILKCTEVTQKPRPHLVA